MKATVFGGQGFIGQKLVERLSASGWECVVPRKNVGDAELRDLGQVFYCAGVTADYSRRPFDTVEAHVSLLNRVLASGSFDALVYLSSTRLYDSSPDGPGLEDRPLSLDPNNPRHIFDLSKALGESLCRVAGQGRARVARLSCVYLDQTDADGFLGGLLRQLLQRMNQGALAENPVEVDSSPEFVRDYVHLDDVLDALLLIASRGRDFIYNVASGENVSNQALFATLGEATGCQIKALRRDVAPRPARISIAKLKQEFGWRPVPVLDKLAGIIKGAQSC